MARSYYSADVSVFLQQSENEILGELSRNSDFAIEDTQRNAWLSQITILKLRLADLSEGRLIFEYTIPRIGKRIDNVLLYKGLVFLLEFKVGDRSYQYDAIEQVMDYALDLKNFHKDSHHRTIVPILIATLAPDRIDDLDRYDDGVVRPLMSNGSDLSQQIDRVCTAYPSDSFPAADWEASPYAPTPTIIEAAQALYSGHGVADISRSDAGADNLTMTAQAINEIIDRAKAESIKCICFVTGVPGAGKTLAGLNIANERHRFDEDEHAVFLSGNQPLVHVLQEALARDEVAQAKEKVTKGETQGKEKITKKDAARRVKAFIQMVHHFRDEALNSKVPPHEKVAIFDEAQRAWTREQTASFMKAKKGVPDFDMSEPEFLIGYMDRHTDWAVVICLVGGGQEINTGEAGLPEWFASLRRRYVHWRVFVSSKLSDAEYTRASTLGELVQGLTSETQDSLHLAVSLRSFRSERVSDLVKSIVDGDLAEAKRLYSIVRIDYPITLTRNLADAKAWIRRRARGSERYGSIASSGGTRLKPHGIWTQFKVDAPVWFLNNRDDVRSSFYLEDVATEFDIQGLELDWALVAWDADFRYVDGRFVSRSFKGTKWNIVKSEDRVLYLKNAYRVLLTRARQGMVIFVPEGDDHDKTRLKSYYDGTYEYLKSVGLTTV